MEGAVVESTRRGRAAGTLPPQPRPARGPSPARRLGTGVLGASLLALGGIAFLGLRRRPRSAAAGRHVKAARYLHGAASVLSLSVLADSGLQHYRGTFHNPAMYVAPTMAAVSMATNIGAVLAPRRVGASRTAVGALALVVGTAGTGFHVYNVVKREGGASLLNLFYGAPLGAPFAIALAGLAGLAAARLVSENEGQTPPTLLGLPAGKFLALGTAGGFAGTAAEAALLHFRGAFHDPFMYVPVTVPPATALVLAAAVRWPHLRRVAKALLRLTAAVGCVGVGFHLYGIQRNMGGFGNWSQNILQGPPLPAPPAFTGVALAGLAALSLMEDA